MSLATPFFISFLIVIALIIIVRVVWFSGAVKAETEADKRMKDLLEANALGEMPLTPEQEKKRRSAINSLASKLSNSSTLKEPDGRNFMNWLEVQLVRAGLEYKYTPEKALALALSIWALGVGIPLLVMFISPLPKFLLVLGMIVFAIYPPLKLRSLVKDRQDSIEAEIPFFINNLYMSLSTGMTSIDQAILRVARSAEEDPYDSILAEEFARAQLEYSMGRKTMNESLREIGRRTGVISVENLVEALIQGDRTGSELTEILLEYSQQAQEMWRQAMRNFKSRKIPAITLWMVCSMFGAAIIFATPLISGMVKTLSGL